MTEYINPKVLTCYQRQNPRHTPLNKPCHLRREFTTASQTTPKNHPNFSQAPHCHAQNLAKVSSDRTFLDLHSQKCM
ncbi:hypothetical protein [Nostoc sp. CALU 1950]|uniref:hypothetical protein n=1 Tax=Nostoc sp. CALU 1950 TaxID=3104321 RepID=UPI003EBA775A